MCMQGTEGKFGDEMPERVLFIASGKDDLRTGLKDAETGAPVVRLEDLPTELREEPFLSSSKAFMALLERFVSTASQGNSMRIHETTLRAPVRML